MSGTCKDCAYWTTYSPHNDGSHAVSACSQDYCSTQRTRCQIGNWSDDDSGLQTWLETGPDFGCVHFKAKP